MVGKSILECVKSEDNEHVKRCFASWVPDCAPQSEPAINWRTWWLWWRGLLPTNIPEQLPVAPMPRTTWYCANAPCPEMEVEVVFVTSPSEPSRALFAVRQVGFSHAPEVDANPPDGNASSSLATVFEDRAFLELCMHSKTSGGSRIPSKSSESSHESADSFFYTGSL